MIRKELLAIRGMKKKLRVFFIIILYVLSGIIISIVINCIVFNDKNGPLLSVEGWAGFLGSYVGGVLGGLGTLIAMYFTIKQAIDIQSENKADMDKKLAEQNRIREQEYNRDKADRDAERRKDEDKRERELRMQFADGIAELIGRYITIITNYYYSNITAERLNKELFDIEAQLHFKENCLITARYDSEQASKSVDDVNRLVNVETKKENLIAEYQEVERKLDRKQKEIEENKKFGNRLGANEAYFIIKTKLMDIREGDGLIEQLNMIHSSVTLPQQDMDKNRFRIKAETEELMKRYSRFRENYVNLNLDIEKTV